MRATTIVVSLVLLATAIAAVPSAQAGLPMQCVMAPCGPGDPAPLCPEASVSTRDYVGYLGPQATVSIHGDCTVDIAQSGTPCASVAPDSNPIHTTAGPAEVSAESCKPQIDCTCDPLPIQFTDGSAAPVVLPSLASPTVNPCPYSSVGCCPGPCRVPMCPPEAVEGVEATVTLSNRCSVVVTMHDNLYNCVVQKTITEGIVTVQPESCQPICACMPASMESAQAPPCACPVPACASFSVESIEARVTWTSSCRLVVTVHDNLYNCVEPKTITEGIVTVQPESCQPICACMPASAGRADPLGLAAPVRS